MATPWASLAAQLEETVDNQMGEKIKIIPYKAGVHLTAPIIDDSRVVLDAIGTMVVRAMDPMPTVAGGRMRQGDSPMLLSVQDKYLGATVAGDHVQFLDPKRGGLECEISFIEPSTNHRPTLHLLRNKVTS